MIIGPNYVFLCVPRCASNTMAQFLIEHVGGQQFGHHHEREVPWQQCGKTRYAVIRHPVDRMLSMWYHTRRCSPDPAWRAMDAVTFARRCTETEFGMDQFAFLQPAQPVRIIRYEQLQDQVSRIWPSAGTLPRHNAELRPPWEHDPAATPEFMAIVHEYAARTFERWFR